MDVDTLVRRRSYSGYLPRPARAHVQLEAFDVDVYRRFAVEPPDDYGRFLMLTDGGQYDHALFYGIGPDDSVLDRCDDLLTGSVLMIGSSGNIGAYVLRPGGAAGIVNLWDLPEVFESFPSFTHLLEGQVTGASRPSAG